MTGALIKNWWAVGIVGGLALILGAMAFATPLRTLASMVLAGVTQVAAAIALREHLQHTWLVALGGVAMAIFGVYLFASPGGILALAYALGTFAIAYGAMMIVAAFQLKQVHDRVEVTLTRAERPVGVSEETWTRR